MKNAAYVAQYNTAYERMDFMVKSLSERPGRALQLAIDFGGAEAVLAVPQRVVGVEGDEIEAAHRCRALR